MSKNVIQITEYDGFSDEFQRSYLLNNMDKGGIVFQTTREPENTQHDIAMTNDEWQLLKRLIDIQLIR